MKKVGIDIGGTQLRCAIFDEAGNMLEKVKFQNDQSIGPEKNLDKLIGFINEKKEQYQFKGIGIGCPGPLNIRLGKILNPPNLVGWNNFEIVRYFEERTKLKTLLNNDANVAGLAEAVCGTGKGNESVFYTTISTGVGGAYILNEKIIGGANSTAAEIYTMIINEDDYCGNGLHPGVVESQCSGTSLARIASEKYGYKMDTKGLFDLYYKNDKLAMDIIERFTSNMAKALANVACIVDPDIFVIGGSVALHNQFIIEKITEKAKQIVLCPEYLRVELAQFGDDAGLIGASQLI